MSSRQVRVNLSRDQKQGKFTKLFYKCYDGGHLRVLESCLGDFLDLISLEDVNEIYQILKEADFQSSRFGDILSLSMLILCLETNKDIFVMNEEFIRNLCTSLWNCLKLNTWERHGKLELLGCLSIQPSIECFVIYKGEEIKNGKTFASIS